jgi:hypothetical protein
VNRYRNHNKKLETDDQSTEAERKEASGKNFV